jgi:zinc protease
VAHHRLPNGLVLLVAPDRRSRVISYQTWLRVGSKHEQPGQTGIAHLFEHLMFNETEHLGHGEFDRKLEAVGGRSNAATWVDWTFYEDDVPEGELPLLVDLEADRLAHLVLRKKQVDSEKDVVLNERRYRVDDQIEGQLSEELYRLAFTVHPYHHPTIGWEKDIRGLDTQKCRAFYRTYYAPNNAVVVVVGAVDEKEVVKRVVKAYGHLESQAIPSHPQVVEPPQHGERRLSLARPVSSVRLALGYKSPPIGGLDYAALELVDFILFSSRSSRLYQRLVHELEWLSELRAHVAPFTDGGLYEVGMALRAPATEPGVLAEIDAAVARLAANGPTAAELDRARTTLLTDLARHLQSTQGRAELLGSHETTLGSYARLADRIGVYREVGIDQVRAAASRLSAQQRTVIAAVPGGDGAPPPGVDDGHAPAGNLPVMS